MKRTSNYPLFSNSTPLSLTAMCQYLMTFSNHRVAIDGTEEYEYLESQHMYDDGLCVAVLWHLPNPLFRPQARLLRNLRGVERWYATGVLVPLEYEIYTFSQISFDASIHDWHDYQDILAMESYGVSKSYYRDEMDPKISISLPDEFYTALNQRIAAYQAFERYLHELKHSLQS